MPVRVICPHCKSACLVAEQHVRIAVKCTHCTRVFTPQAAAGPPALPSGPAILGPRMDIGSATSVGRIRNRNEDSFLVQHVVWSTMTGLNEIAAVSIADGMGGQNAGHEASNLVIQTVGSVLTPLLAGIQNGTRGAVTLDMLKSEVGNALKEANKRVFQRAQGDPDRKGMGAAVVLAIVWQGTAIIGHVGDCRAYLLRAGRLAQVTQDHSLVARMVQLGQLTPKEAAVHPRKNELSQAVGQKPDVKVDVTHLPLTTGDWLVLACDGLHADLDERTLHLEMVRPVTSAAERARRLVDAANAKGGSDNCTVIGLGFR